MQLAADLERIMVLCQARVVADHPRCWARHQSRTDPAHAEAPKALRYDRLAVTSPPAAIDI
jgi:hypothetical protein